MYHYFEWDKIDKEKFGQTLKNTRLRRNLTQAKLAERIGVKNTTISNYELGVSLPDYKTFMKLARTLNVDPGIFNVNWRLTDATEDVVPDIIQIEKNFFTREFTKYFVYYTNDFMFINCRAFVVPRKYLKPDDKNLNVVVVVPSLSFANGRTVVVKYRNEVYIGIYNKDENGIETLSPFTFFNSEVTETINLNEMINYEPVGVIGSCNIQSLLTI